MNTTTFLDGKNTFRYPPEDDGTLIQGEEEEVVSWDDPDVFNNPEKLAKLDLDSPLIQMARSPSFFDKINFQTGLILNNPGFEQLLADNRKFENNLKNLDEQKTDFDSLIDTLDNQATKVMEIYVKCKSKPFWTDQAKQRLLSSKQKEQVEKWVSVLSQFGKSFEEAINIRRNRRSMLPNSVDMEVNVKRLIEQLQDISKELEKLSKVFDQI